MADRLPPTPVAMLIGTALIAGISGYMIGIASSLGLLPIPFMPKTSTPMKGGVSNYDDESESEEEDIDEGILDHAPNWANGVEADRRDGLRNTTKQIQKEKTSSSSTKESGDEGELKDNGEDCKLVLVVRTDLGMTKGKIAAQCGHATLACYKRFLRSSPNSPILRRWENQGQMKVALQIKSEAEMEILQATAMSLGLVAEVIADAGRTQIEAGSHTVLGIGPGPVSLVNQVTGGLKLL